MSNTYSFHLLINVIDSHILHLKTVIRAPITGAPIIIEHPTGMNSLILLLYIFLQYILCSFSNHGSAGKTSFYMSSIILIKTCRDWPDTYSEVVWRYAIKKYGYPMTYFFLKYMAAMNVNSPRRGDDIFMWSFTGEDGIVEVQEG